MSDRDRTPPTHLDPQARAAHAGLVKTLKARVYQLDPTGSRRRMAELFGAPETTPAKAGKSPARTALGIFLFTSGAAGTFVYVHSEFGWPLPVALLLAPLGGFVLYLLGEAGAMAYGRRSEPRRRAIGRLQKRSPEGALAPKVKAIGVDAIEEISKAPL